MDIDYNTKCYTFKTINFDKGLLDETVDCTYIIHLENNGRLDHVYSELNKFKPTKKACIVFNKGFKHCNKKLIEQVSYQDLTDAFLQCFKNAKTNGYKNILILEDDFIFNEEIRQTYHINNINRFIKTNKDKEFVYHLGLIPILAYPTLDFCTYKSIKSLTMHAAIYSEMCINNLDRLKLEHKHWDVIVENSVYDRYFYYKPLCYQTFPETENSKSWHEKDRTAIIGMIKNYAINISNLNNAPEPGFTIAYCFAKLLCFLFVVCIGFIVFFTFIKFPRFMSKIKYGTK